MRGHDRMATPRVTVAFLNLVFGASALNTAAVDSHEIFHEFMLNHSRTYEKLSPQYYLRLEHFESQLRAVEAHNKRLHRRWTAALNHFSDYTPEEMRAIAGYKGRGSPTEDGSLTSLIEANMGFETLETQSLSQSRKMDLVNKLEEFDWTDHIWTAQKEHIRTQTCGNCWAATSAAMLEAHYQIHRKQRRVFSITGLTECAPNPFKCGGTGGCQGATCEIAMLQVLLNGVGSDEDSAECPSQQRAIADLQEQAPHEWKSGVYRATDDMVGKWQFGMTGFERLPENKLKPLMQALVERGPVGVATSMDWRNYKSGIFDACSRNAIVEHAVLIVGYGKEGDSKYWRLQNSWGGNFGEHGHVRLLRLDDTAEEAYCGEDEKPELGVGCEGGPKKVRVCGACGLLFDAVIPHFEPLGLAPQGNAALLRREHDKSYSHRQTTAWSASGPQGSVVPVF